MDTHRSAIARRVASTGAATLPVLFLCLFLLYPLARILAMGIVPLVGEGASAVARVVADTELGRVLLWSAVQAFLSTLLTLGVGLPMAYVFARYTFPGKAVLRTLLSIPFVLPTVVVSSAFVGLFGSGGALERLVVLVTGNPDAVASIVPGLPAVLLSHVFYNVAVVVRIVGGAWSTLDPNLEEAARVLGAPRRVAFLRITARMLLPSIAAASILVFAFCFSSFGVVLVLGGPRVATVETEIYRQAIAMFDLPAAALLAAVQLVITVLVMYGYGRLQSRMTVVQNLKPESLVQRAARTPRQRLLVVLFGLVPTVGMLIPMLSLAVGSFLTRRGLSLAWWRALFGTAGHTIFWTSPLPAA
ncbi:MAG TPA: ABC transporter permease subunit, partial [Spirochaetia bacterium]